MNGSLFLIPEQPRSRFSDIAALKTLLLETGLIQDKTAGSNNTSYLCGDNFAQLITFMGCSPHLVFEPPEDGSKKYCHVCLHDSENIELFTGQQTAPPRCPSCRFRIADWRSLLDGWNSDVATASWSCPKCNILSAPCELEWRQSGGAARTAIEIRNIFPGEAVPVDQLMAKLHEITGQKWRYFYLV